MRGWSKTRKAGAGGGGGGGGQQGPALKLLSVGSPWWSEDAEGLTKSETAGTAGSRPSESELATLRAQCDTRYKEQVQLFKVGGARGSTSNLLC
jgi:hypothetical protein